jgi:hypothetical protein
MSTPSRGRRHVAAVLALALAVVGFSAQPAAAAAEGNKAINGYAHDVKIYNALGVLTGGPVSAAGVGCSDRAPLTYSNQIAAVSLGGVSLGTSKTKSQATKVGNVQTVTSTFEATALNMPLLLDIGITADAITVTSTVTYDTVAQTFTNSSTMNVVNLKVAGPFGIPTLGVWNGAVDPNEGLVVPNVATIALHATETYGSDAAGVVGKMNRGISVQLLGDTVSTAIGETYAALYDDVDQNWLFGAGEGLTVSTSDDLLAVGPLVPCSGGDPVSNSLASVDLGTLGSTGVVTSTAEGNRDGSTGYATTSSEVANLSLLTGGLVTADAVGSTSHVETANGGQSVTKTSTSTFVDLVVAGVPVAADPAVNTYIGLPAGLGYVVLNSRTDFASGVYTVPLVVHLNHVGPTPAVDILVADSYAFVLGPNTGDAAFEGAMKFMSDQGLQDATTDEVGKSGVAPKGIAKGWFKNHPAKGKGNNK